MFGKDAPALPASTISRLKEAWSYPFEASRLASDRLIVEKCADLPVRFAVRVVALYLPQFHPILENNARWGRRVIEWTNAEKTRRLIRGHNQPHIPLGTPRRSSTENPNGPGGARSFGRYRGLLLSPLLVL